LFVRVFFSTVIRRRPEAFCVKSKERLLTNEQLVAFGVKFVNNWAHDSVCKL